MNRKLVFLDIDGTLTIPGSNVPPPGALEAIRLARAAGHVVVLCSGRNLGMLSPLLPSALTEPWPAAAATSSWATGYSMTAP